MRRLLPAGLVALAALALALPAAAQQRIAHVDSEYIMEKMPEFAAIELQIGRLANEWQRELQGQQAEVDALYQEYQARELLYTQEERQRKQNEIMEAEAAVEQRRMQLFGPDGELFAEQDRLVRPLQERILAAIEEVAVEEGYDYVFDRSGDIVFFFARDQYDLSDQVLIELGIDIESEGANR